MLAPFTVYFSGAIPPCPTRVIVNGEPVKHCAAGKSIVGKASFATATSNIFLLQLLASNTYTSQLAVAGSKLPMVLAV